MWVETPVKDIKTGDTIKTVRGSEVVASVTVLDNANRIRTEEGSTYVTSLDDHPINVWTEGN